MLEKIVEVLEWYAGATDADLIRDRGQRAHTLMEQLPDDFAQRLDAALEGILPHLPDNEAASDLGDLLSEMEAE